MIPLWVKPSDQVMDHGDAPVRAAWMFVELPRQIAPPPLTLAVGAATEAIVVAGDEGQPSTVRVTL